MGRQSYNLYFSCYIVVIILYITYSCSDKKVFKSSQSLITIQSNVKNVDSLGTIWIVTIDNTASMFKTEIGSKNQIAKFVSDKLQQLNLFYNVDFEKDCFLFFGSGHLYRGRWEDRCEALNSGGNFDMSFIHFSNFTGRNLCSFKNSNDLINMIKQQIESADYPYQLSFVSQIRVFSIVKAINYLQEKKLTKNFKQLKIITITDDADQNDQWQQDYRTLKDCTPTLLQKINKVNVRYVYNQITGKGFGFLDEFFKYDSIKNVPHIWGYNYTTKQSLSEKADKEKFFNIIAFDGRSFTLKSLMNKYKGNEILFFRLDSVIINNKKHIIGKRFDDALYTDLNYENDFSKNQFKIYGSFQVQYNDSIWSEHYKKYFLTQTEELPTVYRTAIIHKTKNTAIIILALFMLWVAVILPSQKLFVLYDNQGRKFVVRRGWKWQWRSGIIPVLSYVFDKRQSEVIHKKSAIIQKKAHNFGNINDDEFLIVSRYKITVPSDFLLMENDTKQDIEHVYINQSTYKSLFKNIYEKTPQYSIREHLRQPCNEIIQRLWRTLLSVVNILARKKYYLIKKTQDNNSNIRFAFSKWKNKTFVVEIANKTKANSPDVFKRLNIQCMNDYYKNGRSVKSIIGIYKNESYIYWTVLQPEFENDQQNSLKYAYNIFQFKQKRDKDTENQIAENLKVLERTIKRQTGRYQKMVSYDYESLANVTNKYNFEIKETTCPGFLYLQEDNDAKDKTLIFSPFKDGFMTEKVVQVSKTAGAHLYMSFTTPSCLKGLDTDKTLWQKLSDVLFTYNHEDKKFMQIKDVATGKQIILDPAPPINIH